MLCLQWEGEEMATILIVEDEIPINELIKRNLQLVGHSCMTAFDGNTALDIVNKHGHQIDLLILDIMLPKLNGFEVFQQVTGIPTIFLTARNSLEDKLKGLTSGADDYIVKPFEMLELLARVDVILRRTSKLRNEFKVEDVQIDFESRQVFLQQQLVECTPKEFDLLETLVKHRNIALSREQLVELVWGFDYLGDTRTVDVHIQKLRKKLRWEERIKTVYKIGYRLEI